MNRKIIFLFYGPFWERDYHRYGCEYFESLGYDVRIWSMGLNELSDFTTQAGMYEGDNFSLLTMSEYSCKVREYSGAIFIAINNSAEVLYQLVRNHSNYILLGGFGRVIPNTEIPDAIRQIYVTRKQTWKESIGNAFSRGILETIKKHARLHYYSMVEKMYRGNIASNPPMLIFTSVQKAVIESFRPEEINLCNKIITSHSFDYDRYIETNSDDDSVSEEFILFIDSGIFGDMFDSFRTGLYAECRAHKEEYYSQLEVLFSKLTSYFGLEVVIAGHPHQKYGSDDFKGRRIIYNDTARLVKNSKIVVLTDSTAISWVALYNKPLIHVVNKWLHVEMVDYEGLSWYNYIKYKAEQVEGTGFIDLNNDEMMSAPWNAARKFDPIKRKLYLSDYVVDSNDDGMLTYERLEKAIREIVHSWNTMTIEM